MLRIIVLLLILSTLISQGGYHTLMKVSVSEVLLAENTEENRTAGESEKTEYLQTQGQKQQKSALNFKKVNHSFHSIFEKKPFRFSALNSFSSIPLYIRHRSILI